MELTPEWQVDFLRRSRLKGARIPVRFEAKTLDTYKGRTAAVKKVSEMAKAYIEDFAFGDESPKGLLMQGVVGCGKTHVALGVLRGVIEKGFTGLYFNMVDLLSEIRATFSNDSPISENDLIREVLEPDLLVLDDLGAENTSAFVNDRLYLIVNRRYESCKPILVTTNLTIDELSRKLGERTVSRLCEMCDRFAGFPDEDYRKKHMR